MPSDSYTLIISDAGVSTPATGSVTNTAVAANAAIAFSKLAPLTSGNILVGNSSNAAASVALSGDVSVSNTGVATIANDAATFAKMQNVSGYSILGKPTSGSGDVAEVGSSSFMLEASTGFLRQADATSARATLGIVDAATGNALLSGGVGTAPAYGKVGLTTHVSGVLPAANGGTGQSSYAIGDIAYASGATTLSKLADVATGNALLSGGVGAAPVYGKVGLTTHVSGVLPATNGGTGQDSYVIGDITYASSATTLSKLADVDTGNALLSGGVGTAPAYGKVGLTTHVSGVLPAANGGSGQSSYTIGDITYASGATTLAKLADVATGNALLSGGVGAVPVYGKVGLTTHVSGVLPAANGGTGQYLYTIGDIPYASGSTTLSRLSDVATGSVLISGGVGVAPAYGKVGLSTHVDGVLPAANGGTGQSSYTIGDIAYASGSTTLAKLADVATGNALLSGGIGVAPAYGKVGLTTHVSGTLPVANGGTGVTTSTGSGANALATSPTLVTPILGTPTSGTLTSCTGLPLTTGVTGTLPVANGGTGVTTSTGSGANALATSPTLVTPILGTPTSGTLTSCTGLPLTTGVTGTLPVANGGTGVTQSAYGSYYISSITATTIVTAGDYVKVEGTTTSDSLSNFTHPTNNRLTYTGTATRKFMLTTAISFHGTNSNDYKFAFYKNTSSILVASVISSTATGAGNVVHISCQCIAELSTNDFIEVFVTNLDSTGSATVDFMNVAAMPLL